MNDKKLELTLQGLNLELTKISYTLDELKAEVTRKSKYDDLPEWINIDLAIKMKGGCSPKWIKNNQFLQPCCGTNFKRIGGRKCWDKEAVIFWLAITDSELKNYAESWKVKIPEKYEKRSA